MALSSKIATPIDFRADPHRVEAVQRQLEARGVQTCYAVFVDINGVPKAKATPVNSFDSLCNGHELCTIGATEGLGLAGLREDECAVVPDMDSLIVFPWDHKQAWFSADLYYHGEPYANDPRGILRRQLHRAAQLKYCFNLGVEPEFYVFRRDHDGRLRSLSASSFVGATACYDLNLTIESKAFLEPMQNYLQELDWGVMSYDHECGRGQYELNFQFRDALKTADRFVFLRFMARHVAQSINAIITYMPKPFSDDFRSGAHFNASLADLNSGANLFSPNEGCMANRYGVPFSNLAFHFLGGLLKHADALTAVGCPTYNSYQGLYSQAQYADSARLPIPIGWGYNDRSTMLRLPMNRPCIEHRAVDMACNPYLAAALTLAAGLDGIERQADPGEPISSDIDSLSRSELQAAGIRFLPPTLLHALEGFDADPLVTATFGEMKHIYFANRMAEWQRHFYRVSDEQRESMLTYI
jgi:glutamine synthetase